MQATALRRGSNLAYAPRDLDRRDQLRPGQRAGEAVQRAQPQDACASTSCRARPACASRRSASIPQTGEEVPYEDIVKGYEIAPDRYVVIEPGELERSQPKKTKTIEIEDFVELVADRPDLLRPPLLPRARPRRRQALPAAAGGDARDRQGGDRARGDPLQGAARGDPPDGRRARDGDDDVRRRSAPARAPRRDRRGRARSRRPSASSTIAKQLVDSLAGDFEPRQVPRHLPRGGARADRAQGAGRGDRRAAAARGGRARRRPT